MLTTSAGIRLGIQEGNPVMASALAHGELTMYGLKIVAVAAIILLIARLRRHHQIWPASLGVIMLTSLVVASNVSQILEVLR